VILGGIVNAGELVEGSGVTLQERDIDLDGPAGDEYVAPPGPSAAAVDGDARGPDAP